MDKIMTTVQNLQGDNNKLRSQLVVEESRTASAQKHSENRAYSRPVCCTHSPPRTRRARCSGQASPHSPRPASLTHFGPPRGAVKSALETSSANNLVLENEVARWNAAYNALEQSHGTLKQDSIRMNNEVRARCAVRVNSTLRARCGRTATERVKTNLCLVPRACSTRPCLRNSRQRCRRRCRWSRFVDANSQHALGARAPTERATGSRCSRVLALLAPPSSALRPSRRTSRSASSPSRGRSQT